MKLLYSLLIVVLLIAACTGTSNAPQSAQTTSSAQTFQKPATDPVQAALDRGAPMKEIAIKARRFAFEPSTITVNQGDVVKLVMTSGDVGHGIAIPNYNINLAVPGGEQRSVTFVADKKGEFPFYCSVYCGSGHGGMRGLLVVK